MRPSARVVGYLGRTSLWPVAAVGALAAYLFALHSGRTRSAGDWWWSYNALAQTLSLAIVMTAFVAGWDSGRRGSGVADLLSRGPVRAWAVPVLRTSTAAVAVIGGYVLAVGVLVVLTLAHDGRVDWRLGYVLPDHLLMLGVAAGIGTFVGRRLPSASGSVAAAAAAAAMAFVAGAPGQQLFGLNGGSAPAVGFVPSAKYFLWNLTVLVAAAIILLWTSRRPRQSEGVEVLLGLSFIGLVLCNSLVGPSNKFIPSGETASKCFESSSVEVCVFPGYDRIGKAASTQIEMLLDLASQRGVPRSEFPSRYMQQGGGSRTVAGVGTLEVPIAALRLNTISPVAVADSVSAPTWCPAIFGNGAPVRLLRARQLVLDWLLYVSGDLSGDEMASGHAGFVLLSPREQATTVSATLQSLRQCRN